jgi:hypothetical protein
MGQMKCAYKPNPHVYVGTWMDNQLQELDDRVTNATPTGIHNWPKGCQDGNTPSGDKGQVGGKCLWFNESAPFVQTDMFVVQGMPGVWDMHCQYEAGGAGIGPFPDLVDCSAHGNYFFTEYQCAQYPDHCLKTIMKFWEVPLQEKYLHDVVHSGHGGFVHSCFLGAYWNAAPYPNPVLYALSEAQGGTGGRNRTWWHQIKINGVSMHDAVANWWNGSDTSKKVHSDCFYNAQPSGNWSAPGVPQWPGTGTPPANPDSRMPWYTSRYNCNPTCWGNPFY